VPDERVVQRVRDEVATPRPISCKAGALSQRAPPWARLLGASEARRVGPGLLGRIWASEAMRPDPGLLGRI
jgi:hypothetical protein